MTLEWENGELRAQLAEKEAELAAEKKETRIVRERCTWLEHRVNELELVLGQSAVESEST